ncbi:DUF4809 family protein [Vagococcus jeotgali]|uniref:DUF4809 family protein n=1 Tax=Vagococcus jeotgali TaxID=3109030 RepID=UPI002DD80CEA|nr:DUF4809 family protein [Vagococcus sp. B2T-5]
MKETILVDDIMIYCSTEIVEGGCNVCPTTATQTYDIEVNHQKKSLGELDVLSLLMSILPTYGFTHTQEYDVDADIDVYQNKDVKVSIIETYMGLDIRSGAKKTVVKNIYDSPEALFNVVNDLFVTYFNIPTVTFKIDIPSK